MSYEPYVLESKTVGTLEARIVADECASGLNPRDDTDWNTALLCMHMDRYDLPNELDVPFRDLDSMDDVEAWVRREVGRDLAWMGRIVGHDHGTLRFHVGTGHDYWDGGYAGVVVLRKSRIRHHMNVKRVTAKLLADFIQQAKNEVERYSDWAAGDVYIWDVVDTATGEILDSCGGYIGDDEHEYMMSEAVSAAEWHMRERAETALYAREQATIERLVGFVPTLDRLPALV